MLNIFESSSFRGNIPPVGARVVRSGRVGLHGRPSSRPLKNVESKFRLLLLQVKSSEPVRTQRIGKFIPVVEIELDNVPDDPLARDHSPTSLKSLLKVGGCPSIKSVIDHVPGCLKPTD